MDTDSKPSTQDAVDSIVLEEEIDPNYVPSEPEVVEYAKWMGMDLDKDQDLFWIAREGLMAPLPKDWKPCKTKDTEDIYYFNFTTGDSTWDHPCDGYYKRLYEEEKKKKETVIKESGDQNRSKAKQDVEQLLGKAEKKKNKKVPRALGEVDMVKALPAPLGLQKAPLPGISNPLRMSAPSSLGPLGGSNSGSSSSMGGGDPLGNLGKGTGLLRKADLDMKVSSSLEGPRLGSLISSRDPSPLHSSKFTAPLVVGSVAEEKMKATSIKPIVEQKGNEEEQVRARDRESESDVERRMGRLDVTAGLTGSSKTRSLGAASKLRSALPSASSPVDRNNDDHEWQNSPSEEKQSESGRYNDNKAAHNDDKSEDSMPSGVARKESRGSVSNSPSPAQDRAVGSSASAGPSALSAAERDVTFYKNKCADMERRVEEYEVRVADYKTSYNNAKEDLLALERRYESSQSQWMDRLRAVEVEKDKVEGERRQLKLTLIDLEATVTSAKSSSHVAVSNSSMSSPSMDEATKLENDRLAREVDTLKRQVLTAEANLTRSTAAHLELQQRLLVAENDAQRRISILEGQHTAAFAERAELLSKLEASKKHNDEKVKESGASAESDLMRTLQEEKAISSRKDAELDDLRRLLQEEQSRSALAMDAMRTDMAMAADAAAEVAARRSQESDGKLTELQHLLSDLQAKVTSLSAQLQKESAENALLKSRAQTAESTVTVLEATVAELRSLEAALKRDIADRDRKLSDQQEQALALAASTNLSTNVDNERSAQFEVFVSQATAIRKSLKAEIERQKTQLSELESEKSALVTQLTRQETTLQFAKKELNAVADLKEANRQLDSEKQQLVLQLEATRSTLARQAEQEFQLSEKREKDLQARVQSEALCSALRQENDRLVLTLEQERTSSAQSEKKIKSYQEELLQLQRRLAEKAASPQKVVRSTTEATSVSAFSPASSPLPFTVDTAASSPAILDYQLQLAAKQKDLDQAAQDLAASAAQLVESGKQLRLQQHAADMLSSQVADLREQLHTVTTQLSEARVRNVDHNENLSAGFQKEKELFDVEKLNLCGQIKVLQSQLSSAQENFEHISASSKRLEAEVSTYREKWLTCEKDLTDARLQLSASTVGADLTTSALRIELREALAGVQHGKAVEEALRAQVVDLRKSLEDRDSTIRDLRAEALRVASLPRDEKDKENMPQQSSVVVPVPAPAVDPQQVLRGSKEYLVQQDQQQQNNSSSTQHIVALSLEVGRQQATMERLEQHIRNTEIVLQEIKTQGGQRTTAEEKKSSTPASPVAARKNAARTSDNQQQDSDQRRHHEEEAEDHTGWSSSTPESQQSLLVVTRGGNKSRAVSAAAAGTGEFSSSPARRARNRQKTAKLVQFQVPSKNKGRHNTVTTSSFVELIELVDLRDRIASLIEDMDMDVHDCTTLSASMGREHDERIVQSTAQRVLIEGKARVKQEAKLFKEVQAICLAAKDSITHNQNCVNNLKAAWRTAKSEAGGNGGGDHSVGGISTDSVNSVTLKVNGAVDELREAQQMTKARESRMKSLLQSVQYLEQLVNGTAHNDSDENGQQQYLEHLMEIMRLVQEKCVDSAADLAALVQSYRSKGTQRGGRVAASASSSNQHQQQQHRHQQEYAPPQNSSVPSTHARGVAFTTYERPSAPVAEPFIDHYSSVPVPLPPGHGHGHGHGHAAMDGFYYRTIPEPQRQQSFSSLPMPVFSSSAGAAVPSAVAVSAAVSSMRNSELKNRLLQEQIAKITERQSLSKAAYDKHAGWLSTLGREISGVVHGGGGTGSSSTNNTTTTKAFAPKTSSTTKNPSNIHMSSRGAADDDLLLMSSSAHRTFGTPLHNQLQQQLQGNTVASSDSVLDALLQKL